MKKFCFMVLTATMFLWGANAQTAIKNDNTSFSPAPDLKAEEIEMKVNAANPYTLFKKGTIAEYCFQYKGKQVKLMGGPTYFQQIVSDVKIENGLLVAHIQGALLNKKHEQLKGTGSFSEYLFPVEVDTAGNYHLTHNFIQDVYRLTERRGFGVFIPGMMKQGMQLKTNTLYDTGKNLFGGTVTIETKYSDWKVEGEETITTPAGTFDCVKLTGILARQLGSNGKFIGERITCWMARGIGIVQYETIAESSKKNDPFVAYLNKIDLK